MAYTKQTYTSRQVLTAANMNHIESGIYDAHTIAEGKQEALVSGETIKTVFNQSLLGSGDVTPSLKTINGESLLGEGDITISGGTVKSVNGEFPDAEGNIQIETSAPTDEQVSDAVNVYLQMNPVEPYDDTEINEKIDTVNDTLSSFLATSNILVSESDKLIQGYKWTTIKDFDNGIVEAASTRCILDTTTLTDASSIKIEVSGETWMYCYAIFDENKNLLASNVTGTNGLVWSTDTFEYIGNVKYLRIIFSKIDKTSAVTDEEFKTLSKEVIVTINNPVILNTKQDMERVFGQIMSNNYKPTLRVMTYNAGGWAYGTGGSNPGLTDDTYAEKLLNYKNYFAEITPDLLFMQEKQSVINKTSGDKTNDVLIDLIFPYVYEKLNSVATQSIYPLVSSEIVTLTAGTRDQLKSYIKVGDKQICVLCCHLTSGATEAITTMRAEQIAELLALVQNEEYVIMGGDFNVQNVSEYTAFTDAGYKITNGGYFPEQPTTHGGIKPHDNIIVSPNIYIRNFHLDADQYDKLASDHLPVWCDLVIS